MKKYIELWEKKRTLIDAIRARRWKNFGHDLRHPEVACYNIREYNRRKENCRMSPKFVYRIN